MKWGWLFFGKMRGLFKMRGVMREMRSVLFPVKCGLYSNAGSYRLENAAGNSECGELRNTARRRLKCGQFQNAMKLCSIKCDEL